MKALVAPLSVLETTTLMQVRLQASLEPRLRVTTRRLIHLGLVEETPRGFHVTALGDERCRREARRFGLAAATTATARADIAQE